MSDPIDDAVPFEPDDEADGHDPSDPTELIERARRRHGVAGGILAAGMFGLDQVLTGKKKKEEAPIVVSANSDPIDIDADGIVIDVDDDVQVIAPPQPRAGDPTAVGPAPLTRRREKRRRV